MNILYLINFAGKAGTEKYVHNLIRIFRAAGHECRLCYHIPGALSESLAGEGVPCFRLVMSRRNPLSAAKKLADYCREHGVEVIHAQYPMENIVALLARRRVPGLRVVYTAHLNIRVGLRWKLLNRVFTSGNHRVLAVCREGRELLLQNGVCPERIQIIYNGIEPGEPPVPDMALRRELGLPEDAFVLSILSRYMPEKGLPFLLEALALLKKTAARPFRCLICGDGDGFAPLGEQARALGLADEVVQLGFRSDTRRILLASDLYLNSSSHEAMSFSILEAMSCGLPLVVTDVGGNRDLALSRPVCGLAAPYGDAAAYAAAIGKLMDDAALRASLAAAALQKVREQFDLNRLAWDTFHAYEA